LYSDQQLVQLMKRRGGVGICLNNLRPKGASVKNAARTTDGIGVFMERFSSTCREVAMSGRRGALLELLHISHPEIKTFIDIKKDKSKVIGANISIQLTDEFMQAVLNNEEFELRWPINSEEPEIKEKVNAKLLWEEIITSVFETGDPGIILWHNVIKNSVSNNYGKIDEAFYDIGTNPCGEVPMGKDSCRLMSINLYSFVNNKFKYNAEFDFEKFSEVVQKAQRLMDDLVDIEFMLIKKILKKIELDPEPDYIKEIEKKTWKDLLKTCEQGRRTGLGILGLADSMASLNVKYGSRKSIKVTEDIYKCLCLNAYKSTCMMAKERGTFPIFSFDIEKDNLFLNRIWEEYPELYKLYKKHGRRNIALTTTAPTGSLAILAGSISSGIEPVFSLKYKRRKKINPSDKSARVDFTDGFDSWQEFDIIHKGLRDWMEITGKENIEESPYFQSTANDVDPIVSVDLQSVAQKWVCHAISKTHNVPNNISKETISDIYMRAHEKGLKGVTIFREGSKSAVLVNNENKIQKTIAIKRPKILEADVFHVSVKGEKFFILVGLLNSSEPYELFAGEDKLDISQNRKRGFIKKVKRGKYSLLDDKDLNCIIQEDISRVVSEDQEAITRLVSANLRHGTAIEFVVHQLEKTTGDLQCFAKAISRVLKKYICEGCVVSGEECGICQGRLIRQSGCLVCESCGWSKCN